MTVLIFANGDMAELEWVRPYLDQARLVIAADGGASHLMRLGHPPDVIIGDMDSLSEAARVWLASSGTRSMQYPRAKDETDLELALLLAADHQEEILVFGAMGGRLDQTLANILLLAHPALHGRTVRLLNQFEVAWLVMGESDIVGNPGDLVSLIPMGGDVLVKSTIGLAWPLEDEALLFGPARGVSNVLVDRSAHISVKSGMLLCIRTRKSWQR